jgi:ketosteroid isomerase-like protein
MNSMDLETNRQVATGFYRRFYDGDVEGALALMADDASFWLAGKPGTSATAGKAHTKADMAEIFRRMHERLVPPLAMTVRGTVAEGDKVAVEIAARAPLQNGRVYEQEYHALLTIRDGRIVAGREYMDTEHTLATWYRR